MKRLIAKRKPSATVAGTLATVRTNAALLAAGRSGEAPPEVGRDQRDQDPEHEQQPATAAGTIVSSTESLPLTTPVRSRIAEDDQGDRIEGVVEGDEGDHPAADVAAAPSPLCAAPSR